MANICEGPGTKEVVYTALSSMKNNKSPGNDGLSKEFYMYFFDLFPIFWSACIINGFQTGFYSCP